MTEIEEKLAIANAKIRELQAQLKIEQLIADGEIPQACMYLQTKAHRQAKALDRLNQRVLNQRFELRTLNNMGRGLSVGEFLAAKGEVTNKQVAERLFMETA